MLNQIKTIALLGVLSVIIVFAGGAIGGNDGLLIAFVFAIGMNIFSYFYSDKMALAASRAKPVSKDQMPELYAMVEKLCKRADIPVPGLYLIPEMQANAFATGRDPHHAAVAVTQGLLNTLSNDEVEAVIAHELGHVKNRDILIASVASTLASVVSFVANFGYFLAPRGNDENNSSPVVALLMMIFAPLAATLVQMAVSRQREFLADATAAKLVGSGEPLAQALMAIHDSTRRAPMRNANPAYASMYIGNPLGGMGGMMSKLFSTHPPVEERIKALRGV